MTFEIKPKIINKESINGLPAIIGGLQQDQSNIQNTINTKQTKFNSPYKDWKVDTEQDVYIALTNGNGRGSVIYSNDGIKWTLGSNFGWPGMEFRRNPAYGNGLFVAMNTGNQAFRSEDGITWSVLDLPYGSAWGWNGVVYGNGVFVSIHFNDGSILYSLNGIDWSPTLNPAGGRVFRHPPIYANGKFVAIRIDGKTISSIDGIAWMLGTDLGGGDNWISPILYGGGRFMTPKYLDNTTAYSNDGISWSTFADGLPYPDNIISYGKNKFVSIRGDGSVKYLNDGDVLWQNSASLGGSGWTKPAYGVIPNYPNGVFVSIYQYGSSVAISADGIIWTLSDTGFISTWNPLNFVKNKFISLSYSGRIVYSSDLVNWTLATGNIIYPCYQSPIYQKISKSKTIGQILGI